ncbi:O-antigen ligase family protein [Ruminococcus flavefaciens]|uniref:O-antigen ligase family protein n=1 Tax=Ruminococcus flavefaciens TaxID=1265 RepID=UPI00031355BE|nr:O-antigen ligase family protein [Ruminococcus flavefaciens]
MRKIDRKKVISFSPVKLMGFVFFLYTLGNFCVPMLQWNERFVQIPLYLLFLTCLFHFKIDFELVKRFVFWYMPFIILCFVSLLYSPAFNDSHDIVVSLIMAFFFGLSVSIFLSYEGALSYIKYSYILVSIYVGICLILTFQQKSWWSRLGESFGMNENLVALYFVISFSFTINELGSKKHLLINISSLLVSTYVILLTGSKKALFAAVIYAFLFFILRAGKVTKRIRVILISSIALVVLFNLIMNVELLYNILGFRIQAMINTFVMHDFNSSSNSTGERADMIIFGLNKFVYSPLWGWGLNAFRELYGNSTGHYAYAHNNYVEILADLGVIGFCSYYSIFNRMIYIIRRMGNRIRTFSFDVSLVFLIVFYDIAMVSYYDTRIIMLVMIAYSGLSKSLNNYRCEKNGRLSSTDASGSQGDVVKVE